MKIYLAYSENYEDLLREENARVIISYGRKHGKSGLDVNLPGSFNDYLIDSGGFQLIMKTAERGISVEGYSLWLKFILDKYGDKIKGYMSLDLFPKRRYDRTDIERTMNESVRNTEYMYGQGLTPIPVWKTFWPEDVLDYYCALSEYVAIGGLVGYQGGKTALRHLFERIAMKYPKNRFHMLGVGIRSTMAFRSFEPYSVDFSTWSVAARFGHELVPDKKQYLKEVALSKEDKERVKSDPGFLRQKVQESLRLCMSLEDQIHDLDDPYQGQMLFKEVQ